MIGGNIIKSKVYIKPYRGFLIRKIDDSACYDIYYRGNNEILFSAKTIEEAIQKINNFSR